MMIKGMIGVAAAAAAVALAVPATATQYLVTVGGLLQQTPTNPPGTIRLDLPQISGGSFLMQFVLDGTSPGTVRNPPGGVGESRGYFSALLGLEFSGPGIGMVSTPGGATQLSVLNNTGGNPQNPSARLDQVTFAATAVFVDGQVIAPFALSVAQDFDFPENVYLSSFTFGRSQVGDVGMLPDLIDSADFPTLDQVWANGPYIFNMQFRQGNPGNPAEQNALPWAVFSANTLFVDVVAFQSVIPEPATWGMMIAGFGLVGSALRRRRMQAA